MSLNPLLGALRGGRGGGGGGPSNLWSRVFPHAAAGDDITIGAGETVIFDLTTSPDYGCIENHGTLLVTRTHNTELRFVCFENFGVWEIGTEADPFPRTVTHTITPLGARAIDPSVANPQAATGDSNRGVMCMPGGEISWIAAVPSVVIFKLGDTASAGASSITASVPVTLKAGDWLELGTSMYWQEGMSDLTAASGNASTAPMGDHTNATFYGRRPGYGSEMVQVASDVTASTTIPINHTISLNGEAQVTSTTLQYTHHGKLQYLVPPAHEDVAGTNLSYTHRLLAPGDTWGTVNGSTISGTRVLDTIAAGGNPVLDNRATVGLLTHPIKFGAPLDTDWTTYGYGAHLMVMGLSSKCRMQGVERYRVGQAGFLGRYPDHQHMRSYTIHGLPGQGTFLGDVDPDFNYIQYCSMRDSSNRGSTIHGTCGFTLLQNVYSKIDTHCLFLEDGSEERNVIDGNFVSGVSHIGYGAQIIKQHDFATNQGPGSTGSIGPSGIWYTNPVNHLRNNIVAGAYVGIWNTFSSACFGLSRDVAIVPRTVTLLEWDNNEAHSCVFRNMVTGHEVTNEAGTMTVDFGLGYGGTFLDENHFLRAKLWKSYFWYENRAFVVNYDSWQCAGLKDTNLYYDPEGLAGIHGVAEGNFRRGSFFTHTLDDYYRTNLGGLNTQENGKHPIMTTYHNTVHRVDCIFVPAAMGTMMNIDPLGMTKLFNQGGTLALWDYYENPVEMQFVHDLNTVYLGATPGYPGVIYPPMFQLNNFPDAYLAALGKAPGTATFTSWRNVAGAHKLPPDGSMFERTGWWVFDHQFFLYGVSPGDITVAASAPTLTGLNGVLVPDTYNFLGLWALKANGVDITGELGGGIPAAKEQYYTRLDPTGTTSVAEWDTLGPGGDINYFNKRHACTLNGAVISTRWNRAQVPLPVSFYGSVWGMTFSGANIVWAIDWNHLTAVSSARMQNYAGSTPHTITAAASKAALLSETTNNKYWIDTANDKLWLHLFPTVLVGDYHGANEDAYNTHNVHEVFIN